MILEGITMDINKDAHESVFKDLFKKFQSVTKSPETYLRVQTEKAEKSRALLKLLFDYVRSKDVFVGEAIPFEIAINHVDDEQIWQQLELMNDCVISKSLKNTSRLLAGTDEKFLLNYKKGDEESEESEAGELVDENESASEGEKEGSETPSEFGSDDDVNEKNQPPSEMPQKNQIRKSVVDDKFFKLSEMEAFLDSEDKKEMRKKNGTYFEYDNEEIDYFNGEFSEDDNDDDGETESVRESNANYSHFFAGDSDDEEELRQRKREARNKKNKLNEKRKKEDLGLDDSDIDDVPNEDVEELDDVEENSEQEEEGKRHGKVSFDMSKNSYRSDSEGDGGDKSEQDEDEKTQPSTTDSEIKSAFELRQERLRNRISEFEDAALGEKTWQLKGEITSTSRPQNSLLEEVLEFESTVRPAPIITEETTLQLEDIIKQRIKDKAWNDVERKYKPVNTPQEFRKKLVLDQEKSKESLAQIYEKEYLNAVDKVDPNAGEKDEEEPKEHKEIRNLMKSLFVKLDALSNFYYTPKPAMPEVKIITNTPAINMEEVAPISVSDAALLAPEEIRHKTKGDVMGKSERSATDKKRERRMKKLKQKSIKIAKEKRTAEKEKQGISLSSKEERQKLMNKVTKSRNVQKIKETTDGKSIKSSKAFFSQLQDEVSLKTKNKSKRKSSKNEGNVSAKKLKL